MTEVVAEVREVYDPARLLVLEALGIMDTAPEPGFDDIVKAAAAFCETPIALVSLVDDHRQWFKARVGLEICETPVEQAVCAYTLDRTDLLVIPDLTLDDRTRTNPLVTTDDGLRFYAGAPLRMADGKVLGSLCVIDVRPRPDGLTLAQQAGLEALGRQVMNVIALRRRILDRETSLIMSHDERRMLVDKAVGIDAVHAVAQIGTFEIDIGTGAITVSDELRSIYGLPSDIALTASEIEALVVADDQGIQSDADSRSAGTAALDVVYRIRRPSDGATRTISRKGFFERDSFGNPTRMFGAVQDITEQSLINQELSHRLKNMLAMVMALASQTLKRIADQTPVEAFEQRLIALGHAHDALLRQHWVSAPIREIALGVVTLLGQTSRLRMSGPVMALGPKAALGLSLVLHELTTNAIKYGALSNDTGHVELAWSMDREQTPSINIEWTEVGGPAVSPPSDKGFGSRLIALGLLGTGGTTISYLIPGLKVRMTAPLTQAQAA